MVARSLILCLVTMVIAVVARAVEPPAKYASPQEVYSAYVKAARENQAKTAWNCLTETHRKYVLFEFAFALGMRRSEVKWLDEHFDEQKSQQWRKQQKLAADAPVPEELMYDDLYASLKDPFVFFERALREMPKDERDEKADTLRDLRIRGTRARGVVTGYIESISSVGGVERHEKTPYDNPVFFHKTEHGWLLDLPTAEEVKAEVDARGPIGPIEVD
jgi:hypothetical protein